MADRKFLGLRGARLTSIIIFVAGAEFLLFGYDQGVVGGILNLSSFTSTFPSVCTTADCLQGMTPAEVYNRTTTQGITVASYNLGCLIGALSTFKLGDLLGRRVSIFLGCVIVSIGAIIQGSSFTLSQFIVGRVICGMGTGINTATVPVWQAECTKPNQRGPIMAFEVSLVPTGVMVSYWVDFGLSFAEPSQVAWRFPIIFQVVFAFFVMSFIMFLPESPRWLVLEERWDEATEVLCALYDVPANDAMVSEHFESIRATIQTETSMGWKELFHEGVLKTRSRTLMAIGIQIMNQFTGINVLTYYATSIFQNEIGLSPFMSRILSGCLGTCSFIFAMGSIPAVHYVNRRRLMIFNLSGMSGSMIGLAVSLKYTGITAGIVTTVFLFVFQAFFALGFAQISWMYPAEITPLAARVRANAVSTSTNWICVFIVVMITPVAFNNIGWRTYLIFAVCNFVGIFVVYFFYPETRNRSLEEIDLIFSNSTRRFGLGAVEAAKTTERHFNNKGEVIKSLAKDIQHVEEVIPTQNHKADISEAGMRY